MTLANDQYMVTIQVEDLPLPEHYRILHQPEVPPGYDLFAAHVLRVKAKRGKTMLLALPEILCGNHNHIAVLEGPLLTMVQFNAIVRINLESGALVRRVECDNMGGLWEIHVIDGGYLIHGEGDIFRYDSDLNRVWQFCGRDILASYFNPRSFWIEGSQIHCRDWEGWHYILDLNGRLLHDYREFQNSEP